MLEIVAPNETRKTCDTFLKKSFTQLEKIVEIYDPQGDPEKFSLKQSRKSSSEVHEKTDYFSKNLNHYFDLYFSLKSLKEKLLKRSSLLFSLEDISPIKSSMKTDLKKIFF